MHVVAALAPAVAVALTSPGGGTRHVPITSVVASVAHIRILSRSAARDAARISSCSAHRTRGEAGSIERKLQPVACEQPPWSRVLLPGLQHPSPNTIATLLGG